MKCLYCEKEMELGYIQSPCGVVWTPKKHLIESFAVLDKNGISLANGAAINAGTVYAYKYSECKKVVIDFSTDSTMDE
ncbi:MAG: hypothetical protein IJD40_00440 [Lachnospiraceae bacterium]|nr:hypothetical protein [Lachnospiraceae bacterium]